MSVNPLDLESHTFLVTGASSGIGRATAVLLSERGARVLIVGRNTPRLQSTLDLMAGTGHRAESFDLTRVDEIQAWMLRMSAIAGPFHGLVHCAGVRSAGPLRGLDLTDAEEILRTNVISAIALARSFLNKSCRTHTSSIVFISSIAGVVGDHGIGAYAASKAAIIGLTKALAIELARSGIRVNCVAPGWVDSEMFDKMKETLTAEQIAAIVAKHPLGLGTPRDVAHAIAFLLADTARWITGSTMVVDGGYTAQ